MLIVPRAHRSPAQNKSIWIEFKQCMILSDCSLQIYQKQYLKTLKNSKISRRKMLFVFSRFMLFHRASQISLSDFILYLLFIFVSLKEHVKMQGLTESLLLTKLYFYYIYINAYNIILCSRKAFSSEYSDSLWENLQISE